VRKGELTRQAILEHAMGLATRIGLEGLTIGQLADDLELSKSGLFAHFQAKETLQLQVLEHAAARFVDAVVRPALTAPRGEPRVRAIFERWLEWSGKKPQPAGCFFVSAATEFDDRPGPVRDRLVQLQKDWLETIANTVRTASAEGHFRRDVDAEQFAHDLYGIKLAFHHAARLLGDARAATRARTAFEALIRAARASAA
jgi:AcrR family transcriptional regulator